ncbi:MAG: hypothetical protein AB1424_02285 [Thermodesulfobacteriota bacterium]
MLLHCPRVQARFLQEKVFLEHDGPAWMLWAEHGGALILRVGNLQLREMAGAGDDSGLFLEVDLSPAGNVIHEIEGFAAQQNLPLLSPESPEPEFTARPLLAACHVSAQKKFIFSEESRLQVRPTPGGTVAMEVRGAFKARGVPSQEADLVIHLTPGDLAGLLSYLRAVARAPG